MGDFLILAYITISETAQMVAVQAALTPLLLFMSVGKISLSLALRLGGFIFATARIVSVCNETLEAAKTAHTLCFYSRKRNLLLYDNLPVLLWAWVVALLQVLHLWLLRTPHWSHLPLYILTLRSLALVFATTRRLYPLLPPGFRLDHARWTYLGERRPRALRRVGATHFLLWIQVLYLRAHGVEPEQWVRANRPECPYAIKTRMRALRALEETRKAQARSDAWDREWHRRWDAERPAREALFADTAWRERRRAQAAADAALVGPEAAKRRTERAFEYRRKWEAGTDAVTVGYMFC
ncbi:hypothetical protein CC85DRAFT_329292 [Cutaneotrichosporon oleaginosum]|uniref:Uncharacterized protein n=1 Tax=Cutaneotrichosporon oleaginosum TaxID=879819 RepID=A0A0J1B0Q3_9TREE|nr:uncharacterized protein CC85DRAFT_329292 [Cutaneotrichosporon oleaginosum]KLT41189.1 hypothetical protein CC85DRAFT_329292 [Cutaneotrichosporon oleaginosum]TXT14094.1 hypothetical protein COLE_00287 [Cutaneotrichosporon oleaginosum]